MRAVIAVALCDSSWIFGRRRRVPMRPSRGQRARRLRGQFRGDVRPDSPRGSSRRLADQPLMPGVRDKRGLREPCHHHRPGAAERSGGVLDRSQLADECDSLLDLVGSLSQRVRRDQPADPQRAWEQPGQGGQYRTVGLVQLRLGVSAAAAPRPPGAAPATRRLSTPLNVPAAPSSRRIYT